MTAKPTLPEELLLKIVRIIEGRCTLLNVLSTSRLFARLGELVLYESVTITSSVWNMTRMAQFRDTVAARKDLAALVRELTLIIENSGEWFWLLNHSITARSRDLTADRFPRYLPRAIMYELPGLRKLTVDCPFCPLFLPTEGGPLVPPFSLTHLRWNGPFFRDIEGTTVVGDRAELFCAFLETQSSLEFLAITGTYDMAPLLSATALPHLRVLQADAQAIFTILPTRNVPHLQVGLGYAATDGLDNMLLTSLEHVKSLRCSGLVREVTTFAARLHTLEYLSLCFGEMYHDGSIAIEACHLLLSLSSKAIKHISVTVNNPSKTLSQWPSSVEALFVAFPSLRAVDLEEYSPQLGTPATYVRYTRQSSSHRPQLCVRPEVDPYGWDLWWKNFGLECDDAESETI